MIGPRWVAVICVSTCLIAVGYRTSSFLRPPSLRCNRLISLGHGNHVRTDWSQIEGVQSQTAKKSVARIAAITIFPIILSVFFGFRDCIAISTAEESNVNTVTADDVINNGIKSEILGEFSNYKLAREPKSGLIRAKRNFNPLSKRRIQISTKEMDLAAEKVLTLKAYLDEAERELFEKHWDNLQIYLFTFAEQEDSFAILMDHLFPNDDELDKSAREAMSFEAKSMYLALDVLRDAAKDERFRVAQNAYAKLLLSYDRFLKAGNLYPTYDVITSTEIFYADIPNGDLKFDSTSKVQVLDKAVLTSGPDMGKTGTVIYIDGDKAVIKLDKDGKAYQEVKYVNYKSLAKADANKASSRSSDYWKSRSVDRSDSDS